MHLDCIDFCTLKSYNQNRGEDMKSRRIALITARADDGEQRDIIYGAADECRKNGFGLAVFSDLYNYWTDDPLLSFENVIYSFFDPSQFEGVIITFEAFRDIGILDSLVKKVRRAKLPAAVIGGKIKGFASIFSDDGADLEYMTEHLVICHGLKHIDILTGPKGDPASEERAAGAIRGLEKCGAEFSESRLHYGSFWTDSGEALAERYLSGELPMPQAVICTNDHMAFGLCDRLSAEGVDIPGHIAVTGYDYTGGRIYHLPLLTTMVRGRYGMGARAVRSVLGLGSDAPSGPPKLVCGGTCGCGADSKELFSELQAERISGYHNISNSSPQLLNSLTLCRTLSEYMQTLQDNFGMLYGADSLTVCIDKKWSAGEYSGEEFLCTRITQAEQMRPPQLLAGDTFAGTLLAGQSEPVVYLSPLVFQKRLFGIALLGYKNSGVYYFAYRDFCKNIANALELLRMKNDITYLKKCINESAMYDSLTHFYNPADFSRVIDALDDKRLSFMALRLTSGETFEFENGESSRTQLIADIARDIRLCCTGRELLCRADENTFLIARRGSSEIFTRGITMIARRALLSREPDPALRIESAVTDSGLAGLDGLFTQPQTPVSVPHRQELLELRVRVCHSPASAPGIAEVCRKMCISAGRFRYLYSSCFGISYTDDCINARIMQACFLLLTTVMSIYAVAGSCGYTDEKYFSRQFSACIGCSPGKFRTLFREE